MIERHGDRPDPIAVGATTRCRRFHQHFKDRLKGLAVVKGNWPNGEAVRLGHHRLVGALYVGMQVTIHVSFLRVAGPGELFAAAAFLQRALPAA